MSDRYEWHDAATVAVTGQPAAEIDDDIPGYSVCIGDPSASAYVVSGTVPELVTFADTVRSAVRGLAVAHLTEELGDVLNALDEPDDEPIRADGATLVRHLRNLVAEADERLADIDGQAEDSRILLRGLDSATLSVLFDLTDGRKRWMVLAELQERAAHINAEIDASHESYTSMDERTMHNFRRFYEAQEGDWLSARRARMIAAEQDRRAAR